MVSQDNNIIKQVAAHTLSYLMPSGTLCKFQKQLTFERSNIPLSIDQCYRTQQELVCAKLFNHAPCALSERAEAVALVSQTRGDWPC